jgi:beta-N-acetylhexosaminidase
VKAAFITDVQGATLTQQEEVMLTNPYLSGIILFTRHFKSVPQLKALIARIHNINPQLLVTVDHEGGRVQRFREGFTRVPAMGKLGQLFEKDKDAAERAAFASAVVLASELLNIGVHLTYAPVLDANYERNQVIGDRAFSGDVNVISHLAKSFMLGLKEMNFAVVGKHFPGHGWVNLDSHVACPVDERDLSEITQQDLQPFKQLLPSIDWMMPAHVVYEQVDHEPAGFSKIWLQDILKQQLGFTGRIVSDDLSMAGAAVKGSYWQRGKAAMEAGCDVLLACNSASASQEILSAMERESVEPMSLAMYQPKKTNADCLQAEKYLQAKTLLRELELIV